MNKIWGIVMIFGILDAGDFAYQIKNAESSYFCDSKNNQNNLCDSTESRPLRGAKNRIQTSSSASADFLLEVEKRGTPPKSEKRQLLARRGSGAGGAALLREVTNEINIENATNGADSSNQEFIISYRAIAKNNILIGEEFKVAKALTLSQNPQIIAICDINANDNTSKITILKQNKDEILACFAGHLDSKIRDDIKSINNEVRTKTTFKIPAQRILLDLQRSKIHIIGQK